MMVVGLYSVFTHEEHNTDSTLATFHTIRVFLEVPIATVARKTQEL